jgi:hypothetical protein
VGVVIVVGVDPGARSTGIAVIRTEPVEKGPPVLLRSTTVVRPADAYAIEAIPRSYLHDVMAAIIDAVTTLEVDRIAVEAVTRPTGFSRGRQHSIDPGPLLGTALVLGAILGRQWSVPVYRVTPRGNGRLFPLNAYPATIATTGKGHDKRRHERSAYDVAVMGRQSTPDGGW